MRPQVFVVEGRNDASRLKQIYPNIQIIITNGSAIDLDAIHMLDRLDETHDIILFLDPDHAGERIRRILGNRLKNIYHVFIEQDVAISRNKKKIGVEHASEEDIIKALSKMKLQFNDETSDITFEFLFEMKLTGHEKSSDIRDSLAKKLNIGHVNGKTLHQRLILFGIKQSQIIEVLSESSS
jgi:ribonuclease M5